ncbi:BTAD domain-containing putative transcriptional regulator [Asanoa iriomotensis]|uniref:SARP family transcriptional regulator n=1 Tax=Asanoa iriomotensis TaxID=234613 RepID=A0ABQ4C1U8_9ACTN|nr:BTAD domain-containing putative transcriptional regulator [Asanoa iriomotensis]GIF56748.1 SARP family transcriptional regulator [Asanoa iriomotensis]
MRFGVLGPLTVWAADGATVPIPGAKVRALLAALVARAGQPVSADRLVDDLWGGDLPGNPAAALAVKVSQLRRALDDAEPGARALVESGPAGFLLRSRAIDAVEFEELLDADRLDDALALWRGPAYAGFADAEFARAAVVRLDERRLTALDDRAERRLALGQHTAVAGELADLVARDPLRERTRGLWMLALYRAGRQAEALDSYADLRQRLADELGLDPGPELAALHRAILAQDPSLDLAPPHTNLPAPLGELFGRAEAVGELTALLPAQRLVCLTGPGGVGKTRLAIEVAGALGPSFPDGVWLVELAGVEADAVSDTLASTLGLRDTGGADRFAALRARRMLLVLDNCEHVIDAAADLVAGLLRAAPGSHVLATSREPLGLAGEVVWPVSPLEAAGAAQLFVARAAAADRGFALDAANADQVALLCRRLDGLPLALELAATRVRALGLDRLVAGLDDRFRLLAAGQRGVPARQQTLLATVDWSWRLLTAPERIVLRRLAAHADGCTMEAAEAVCAAGDVARTDVAEMVARLLDRSLVVRTGRGRYRLLESVSAFCVERMGEAGDLDATRARHRDYYTVLAERAEARLRGPDQADWLRVLDAESANLRAALDPRRDPARAIRLVRALAWHWFLRGRLGEGSRALRAALDAAPDPRANAWLTGFSFLLGDVADRPARHAAAVDAIHDPAERAHAEWFLAYAEIDLGDVEATGKLLARLLDAFRDDRWGTAATLSLTAKLAHVRGDAGALARDGDRSAALFRELGDRWGLLQATEWLGAHAAMTGDHDAAARLHTEGLAVARELGLWADVSGRLGWLGWIAMERGDHTTASARCTEALALAREQGAPLLAVFATMGLAFAARRAGDLDAATTHLRWLLDSAARTEAEGGQPLYLPSALVELGHVEVLRGDPAAAVTHHRAALAAARALGATQDVALALSGLAAAAAADDRFESAARLLGAASAQGPAGVPPPPAHRADLLRTETAAAAALGRAAFDAAYAEGVRSDEW